MDKITELTDMIQDHLNSELEYWKNDPDTMGMLIDDSLDMMRVVYKLKHKEFAFAEQKLQEMDTCPREELLYFMEKVGKGVFND